jgi:hypothetical protein
MHYIDYRNYRKISCHIKLATYSLPVRGCSHIAKAVNFQSMKKTIKQNLHPLGECSTCSRDTNKKKEKENEKIAGSDGDEDLLENMETTIWLCLQCGHQVRTCRDVIRSRPPAKNSRLLASAKKKKKNLFSSGHQLRLLLTSNPFHFGRSIYRFDCTNSLQSLTSSI